jgi:Zn-dependent peptidase ImmA (M78 family)
LATKLRTAAKPEQEIAADEILETLLVEAGTAGQLPTDHRKLLNFLGLEQLSFDFMNEVEFLDPSKKPTGEIRAALHLAKRAVATQSGMNDKRERFCVFHEIAHCVLPEHNLKLFVDDDQTLSWWTKARLEREANRFAADLLFQGNLFSEQALSLDTSIRTVIELAPQYGASYEAALRRYTETHVMPCALLVYDKVAKSEDTFVEEDDYRIHYTITSAPFRKLYFAGIQMTEEKCKAAEIYSPNKTWGVGKIAQKELLIESEGKEKWRFETEVFNNGYKIFQFFKRPITSKSKN